MKTMGKQAKRLLAIVCAMALCATMVLTLHVAADDPTDPPRTNLINAQTKFEPVYIENANDNDAIWVDTHQYGSVTGPGWYQSSWYPSKLYDGATDANAYPNVVSNADYGYGHVWASDGGAATAASRRHGFWFDLGQLYNLNEINVHVPTTDKTVYDYSVYGVADFFATAQADRRTEIQDSMLKSENLIGHYTSTTATAKAQLTVTDNRLVRYILIVFNKSAGDPGNSNVSTAGQYGADHLPGLATPATNGGLYVSEIEVFGDPLTNLLTPEKITAGTQSIKSYKVPTPTTATAKLWDIQYPQSYGTASDHYTSLITSGANGVYDDNLVNGDTATYAWRAWGLDGSNGNRLVHWIDLGDLYFLNSMILHTTTAKTCVYDYSVYASNVVSDINGLLTADHLIGRYSSAKQNAQALSTLDDSVKVRYVAVVLNKLATDPGNSNDTSATASNYYVDTNNRLPGGSYSNGSLHLTEIQVMGEIATPKAAKTFTDDATGLKVDLTTYKTNHQEIDTMAVTQTALSDAQKAVVETADGKVAPGGVYHIAFKDASGAEVTDLRDWEFVVTVPAAKGVDAVLYQLDDQQLPIALNAQKGNGVFTFACKGNAFIHDVIAAATGNLLDIDKLKNGTQKLSGHNVAAPGLLIWDYTNPYTYGTVTDRVAFTESVHAAFVDGNTNTNVYQYGFGSESAGADATYPWDHVAQRRLALFADLGAGYNVSNIDLRIGSTTVYDCSVYASSVASDAASLLKAENLVKHYTGTTAGSINIPLQDINNKRFFLIVFNKLSSDPGNASKTYDGRYGTADAAQVGSTYPSGGLNVTELVFSGVESNPTKEQSFTDTATGITVDMTTYETHYTNVSSMTVTTNTLTDEQKAVVETADGKVAPNGLYNIVFKDANGAEVTDLSDWAFRVTVPLVKGLDKVLYRLDAQQLPVLLDTVIKDGKFTYASEGTFYGDIIAAAKENLLSGDKVAAGTQKITGYNLASNGLLIWDYEHPYTYGAATARSAFSAEILAKLTDGDVENGAFPYGFGSESINLNAENKWDVVANRRLAMFVDLGAGYNVREIDWVLNSGKVYDCSVYASSYAATPATLLKESNLVARYESTDGGNLNFALQNVKNKRYFLFVFNKVHSDPGNASFTCDGRYGTADAAQTGIAYPSGGVYVSEIAFTGELAVPTKAQSFTDAATGVKVDMATFNDSYQNVVSVSVEKKALTDAQNALIKADDKVAPNGTYRLVFKDASGAEVTDLSDWEYTVSVPAAKGTEKVLYALDAQKVPVRLEIEPVDGMFTVSSIDTNAREFIAAAKENLLDIDKIKAGTQKITGHNVASQGLLIWDYKYPYTYGDVSSRALFSETILDKMVDGDTVAGAFPYGFGSESINANAENKWDVVAKRRLGLFVDLGGGYNVNTVQLMLSAGQVYDCSVYASNIAATPDALLKASNLVARYESVEGGDLEFALQNVLNKRYFLFVFNKAHSDPGNASFTCDGRYGTADAAQTGIAYPSGGVYVSEIVFSGEKAVPTAQKTFTDNATGVKVDIETYQPSYSNIASMTVTKKEVTQAMVDALTKDGVQALNGMLEFAFKDANGAEVTDFSAWTVTVTVPAPQGDEAVYALDAQQVPVLVDAVMNVVDQTLTFSFDGMFRKNVIVTNEIPPDTSDYLLNSTELKAGTQSVTGYSIVKEDLKIWDQQYPFAYGKATKRTTREDFALNLVDGDVESVATQYGFGSESINLNDSLTLDKVAGRRLALLINLGDRSNIDSLQLVTTGVGRVYDCTVYGSIYGNVNTLMDENNLLYHYETQAENDVMDIQLEKAKNIQYLLLIFNKLSSDPGNSTAASAGAYGANHLPGVTYCSGGINATELVIKGKKVPLDPNILLNNKNVRLAQVKHAMSWADTEKDYDYTAEDLTIGNGDFLTEGALKWTDGIKVQPADSKESVVGAFNPGRGQLTHKTHRYAFLYDLGGFYNLSEIDIYQDEKKIHTVFEGGSGYAIYSLSVYAGVADDGILMENRVAYYESVVPNAEIKLPVTSDKPFRYVLLVWNKMGTDPGNLWDGYDVETKKQDPVGTITKHSLPGSTWANSGVFLNEIEVRGTPMQDPTDTRDFTDEETGINVHMITYNNDVKITSMQVVKKELTEHQLRVIEEEEGLFAPNGLYHLLFFDANGNAVTDMSGRKYTITFPLINGDETVYVLNSLMLPVYLQADFDLDNNQLVYDCQNGNYYFDFIVATSIGDSMLGDGTDDPTDGQTGTPNAVRWPIVLAIVTSSIAVIMSLLTVTLLVLKKKRTAKVK